MERNYVQERCPVNHAKIGLVEVEIRIKFGRVEWFCAVEMKTELKQIWIESNLDLDVFQWTALYDLYIDTLS